MCVPLTECQRRISSFLWDPASGTCMRALVGVALFSPPLALTDLAHGELLRSFGGRLTGLGVC